MEFKRLAGAILLSTLVLVLCMKYTPAEARNEYLNDGFNRCQYGSFDVSTEYSQDDTDYRHYSPSNDYDNYSDRKSLRFSFRKFLVSYMVAARCLDMEAPFGETLKG